MRPLPLRLTPGQDLRRALEDALRQHDCHAAFVLSGIGSLSVAQVRHAGAADATALDGPLELLGLSGSLADNGAHLHGLLSCADGRVLGGHLAYGCRVRTTAEILLALLPDWHFTRAPDAATGYAELLIRQADPPAG